MKKKNFIQVLLDVSMILIISMIIAVTLLTLVYMIPSSAIKSNVEKSNEILIKEGDYYQYSYYHYIGFLDNFTDAIMIDEAYYESDNNLSYLEKALLVERYGTAVRGLNNLVNNNEDEVCSYSRYWHGYLIILKPLLLVFNISQIRNLNLLLQLVLVISCIILMFKKCKSLVIPYILSLIVISPFITSRAMQYSTIYYIFNFAILFLLIFYDKLNKKNLFGYYFLIIGILTSFFDFLTYPIATLGMPLIVYFALNRTHNIKESLKSLVKLSVFWCCGYVLFWVSKWIITSIVFNDNTIINAIYQLQYRINGDIENVSWLKEHLSFYFNFCRLFNISNFSIFICTLFYIFGFVTIRFVRNKRIKINYKNLVIYAIIFVMPILWFLFAANHTFMHYFTCRNYVVSIFAFYTILFNLEKFDKVVLNHENIDKNCVIGNKIAVLIPCYNEHLTIEKTIIRYKTALPEAEIYVYDNNSNDGSDIIAKKCGAIVRYEKKQGKGNVVNTMFKEIDADCYFMVDADDTYMAENAREMCNMILTGQADMVIGDRLSSTYFKQEKRKSHTFGNKIVRFLINFLYKNKIRDIMTGQRAFSKAFVKSFEIKSKGFEIETEMTIYASDNNLTVKEVPVNYIDRQEGSFSKLDTYKDGIKVLKTIGKMFINVHFGEFLGYISCLFLMFGLVFAIPTTILSIKSAQTNFLLIITALNFILSILTYFIGFFITKIHNKKLIKLCK